jgi:hypothetical protein
MLPEDSGGVFEVGHSDAPEGLDEKLPLFLVAYRASTYKKTGQCLKIWCSGASDVCSLGLD